MNRDITHSKPSLNAGDHAAVARVLGSGMIARGAVTRAFEHAAGQRLGLPPGLATASGTDALAAALLAVGVRPGSEVVMPTYVCDAVWLAIRSIGAHPVLCDVEIDRAVSVQTITPHLSPRTAAVIVVHPFGAAADVASIRTMGVPVIEDCCQAFGATRDGLMTGSLGDACVLSFHATKLLTTGEGGMVLSRRGDVADALARLRDDAAAAPIRLAPLSDLQAALGLSQLERYDEFLDRRRQLADVYFTALDAAAVTLPQDVRRRSIFFRFPLRSPLPFEQVQRDFAGAGVHVRRGVDSLVHRRFAVRGSFPVAEQLFAETVSLPIYPSLTDDQAAHVAQTALSVFGGAR